MLALAAALLAAACAKQGYPSGGPKDETPPVVTGTEPESGTLLFGAKEFVIHFDEYVKVKDADNNILVSPPMKQKPEYKTKGRGIVVKLRDTLRANTTYLFQFKEAIVDFNEGNALPSYEYVFSTGSSIDSMTLRGTVADAFSRKPRTEPVTVIAWSESQQSDSVGDSIVAKVQPMYVTRCDKEGNFALNHLREGRYLLLALEDGDKNLRLNGDEAVAFLDSMVLAEKMPPPRDTTARDTVDTSGLSDSLKTSQHIDRSTHDTVDSLIGLSDSLKTPQQIDSSTTVPDITQLALLMSQEKKEMQRITKSDFTGKGIIEIVTQTPLSHGYSLRHLPADSTAPAVHLYHQAGSKGDTLKVWIAAKGCDSIVLELKDATGLHDTLRLRYKEKAASKPMPGRKSLPPAKPRIMQSKVAPSHPYYDTLWLAFENPVEGVCEAWRDTAALDTAVRVMVMSDSSLSRCGIRLLHDPSFAPAVGIKAYLVFAGKAGEKYQFTVPEGLFYDIYQNRSDSVSFTTEFTKTESYGNIFITLESGEDSVFHTPLIVQLTNEKGDMVREQVVTRPGKISFLHLKGGKHGIRAIVDSNRDGKWTPGNYWQHRQPEAVLFFEKTLELRENWDMEEKWNIGSSH